MTTPSSDLTIAHLLGQAGWLRGVARALLAPAAVADADDLSQDVLLAALREPAAHRGARPWLAGVARHLASNLRRHAARRQRREHAAARPDTAGGDAAADVVARAEIQRRIANAVMSLPAEQRDCILLRYWDALPPREIAARLGVPVETVRTRLKRAFARLRTTLDAEHGGDRRSWTLALVPVLGFDAGGAAEARALLDAPVRAAARTLAAAGAALALMAAGVLLWSSDGHGAGLPTAPRAAPAAAEPEAQSTAATATVRVPVAPSPPADAPAPSHGALLARVDAAWEIEDHWRLADELAREAAADALVAAVLRANDVEPEAGARPLRPARERRSARLATLLTALTRKTGADAAVAQLLAAWPQRPEDELLRFAGRHASAVQLSALVAAHGQSTPGGARGPATADALVFAAPEVLRQVALPDQVDSWRSHATLAAALARGDAQAFAGLERWPAAEVGNTRIASLLALAEAVLPCGPAAGPESARFWFAPRSGDRVAAARAVVGAAKAGDRPQRLALGALPVPLRLDWVAALLADEGVSDANGERALVRALATTLANLSEQRFAKAPSADQLELAALDGATGAFERALRGARPWRAAVAQIGLLLARSMAGCERAAMQDEVVRVAELAALAASDPDEALDQALKRAAVWLIVLDPASRAASMAALAACGELHCHAALLARVAAQDPRLQPAWAPVYWQLAGPGGDPEVRERALVLALTFEPDGARVQRELDEARRARGHERHAAIAHALPLRWRHGHGELWAATDWLAKMLEQGTLAQVGATFDGLEDGFDQALGDNAHELAAAILARLPRPDEVPRLDARARSELERLRKDLEEREERSRRRRR